MKIRCHSDLTPSRIIIESEFCLRSTRLVSSPACQHSMAFNCWRSAKTRTRKSNSFSEDSVLSSARRLMDCWLCELDVLQRHREWNRYLILIYMYTTFDVWWMVDSGRSNTLETLNNRKQRRAPHVKAQRLSFREWLNGNLSLKTRQSRLSI